MWREVEFEDNLQVNEFQKVVCFISEDILSFEIQNKKIKLKLSDKCDGDKIVSKVKSISKQYINGDVNQTIEHINQKSNKAYYLNILSDENLFCVLGNGLISLKGKAIFLFNFFENEFRKMADEMGAVPKIYPVLLPVDEYIRTGYMKRSPQYSIFCSNLHENMDELEGIGLAVKENKVSRLLNSPHFVLSPSACFHVYLEYKGNQLENMQTVSFTQSVFRNEGRLNYGEIGRLMDYHVREIVFLGDEEYVQEARKKALEKTKQLLFKLDMKAIFRKASDPFILPKMQKYRKIQMVDSSKYEISLCMGEENVLAACSFNYHGTAFTRPFEIGIKGCESPVTGCVGFGIERWVMAFLTQFGPDIEKWPELLKNEYQNYDIKFNNF